MQTLIALVLGIFLTPLAKALEDRVELPVSLGFFVLVVGLAGLGVWALIGARTPHLLFGAVVVLIATVAAIIVDERTQSSIDVEVGGRRVAGFSPQPDFAGAVEVRPGDRLELDVKLKGRGDVDERSSVAITVPRNPDKNRHPQVVALQGRKRDASGKLRLQVAGDGLVRLGAPTGFRYRRRSTLLKTEDEWATLAAPQPEANPQRFAVKIPSSAFGLSNRFKEVRFEFQVDVQPG